MTEINIEYKGENAFILKRTLNHRKVTVDRERDPRSDSVTLHAEDMGKHAIDSRVNRHWHTECITSSVPGSPAGYVFVGQLIMVIFIEIVRQ